jgi:hypothetical protein
VHAVAAPWAEGAVTWNSFGGAYAPAAVTSFASGGTGYQGPVSFDLTAQVKSWYAGAAPNHGIALVSATNNEWASSESAAASARPALQVCYQPSLCAGVTCAPPDACHTAAQCDPATGACVYGNSPANTACGFNKICDGKGTCVDSVLSKMVHCGMGWTSGDQLCQSSGFTGASDAHGYWFGECAGTLDRCPGGWQGDGTQCPDWCTGTACTGINFCSNKWGWTVIDRDGDGSTLFKASEYWSCPGWNPGWTVRVRCFY